MLTGAVHPASPIQKVLNRSPPYSYSCASSSGGAGFIGSNLAETLAQHHDVVVIDNLATGRRENVEHLLDHPRVTFVEGSITDLDLLMETSPSADGIFHQAAIPSVPRSVIEPPRLERGERDRHGERARGGKGL